jgi:hypothetical protein
MTAGVKNEQDPFERGTVVDPRASAGPRGAGRGGINGSIIPRAGPRPAVVARFSPQPMTIDDQSLKIV